MRNLVAICRVQDGKYKVIWLPGATYLLQSSVHGPNVNQIWHSRAQERTAWAHLRPGVDFMGFNIQLIFELFPLPHGTQRQAVCQLLKDWEWQAKRLQPGKGNFGHMAWRVGPQVPPPHHVMKGFQVDIVITQIKELKQQHLRAAPAPSASSRANIDPWLTKDPWSAGPDQACNTPRR
jgi:hypothetical protein